MTIHEFDCGLEIENKLISKLLESDRLVDPAWPYFEIWKISGEITKQHGIVDYMLVDTEDVHPEIDEQLIDRFRAIKGACDHAINLLRERDGANH